MSNPTTPGLGTVFYYPRHSGPRDLVTITRDLADGPFDHLFLTETYTEIFTTAAAMVDAAGDRLTLGTAISNIYFHHPYEMAMAVANLAHLTQGRFVLGVGTGHQEVNVSGLGLDMAKPVTYMREYLDVLRACLDSGGAPVDVTRSGFQVTGLTLPWGKEEAGRVPVILGVLGDPMTRLAATSADGVVLSHATPQRVRQVRELLGPDARIYAIINVVVEESRERGRDRIRPFVSRYTRFPFYRALYERSGVTVAPDGSIGDDGLDQLAIAGPTAYVRERVAEFREAGVDLPVLSPAGALDPQGTEDLRRTYDDFATAIAG